MTFDLQLKDTHEQVWDLLPWYVNGTLDDNEENQVKAHLLSCRLCHDELERCQNVVTATHLGREQQWQENPDQLDKLLSQIDINEAQKASRSRPIYSGILVHFQSIKNWLFDRSVNSNWHVAVPVALALIVSGALVFQLQTTDQPSANNGKYQTLTSTGSGATDGEQRIQVIFSPDSTSSDIVELLKPINARIVDGPTQHGRFTIVVGTEMNLDIHAIAGRLRDHNSVMFAQPEN